MKNDDDGIDAIQLALARFHYQLTAAAACPDDRRGAREAINATMEFISSINPLSKPENAIPFFRLLQAFNDVDDNIVPPLFDPGKRRPGRPLDSTAERTMRACASATMELLMDCLKYSKEDAGRLVALECQKLGLSVGNTHNVDIAAAAATVASWRDTAKAGNPDKDHAAKTYYDFIHDAKPNVSKRLGRGDQRSAVEKDLLTGFANLCRLTTNRSNPPFKSISTPR
jgi:hypothetical protein